MIYLNSYATFTRTGRKQTNYLNNIILYNYSARMWDGEILSFISLKLQNQDFR